MEAPKISTLLHTDPTHAVITLKLNNEIVRHFNLLLDKNVKPKLVVKDGKFSIKISEDLVFPCSQIPEYSHLDIYSKSSDDYVLKGKVRSKLSINPDPKVRKEPERLLVKKERSEITVQSTPSTPLNFDPYLISIHDTKLDILNKFLYFLALGPVTKEALIKNLKFKEEFLSEVLPLYCQNFNPKDTFLADDVFPNKNYIKSSSPNYILKDKSYKDIRPWSWKYYSDAERTAIINNINNALTRLGYLETHPLRKKIVVKSASPPPDTDEKKKLGGGLLITKKVTPFKRAPTDSPKIAPPAPAPIRQPTVSPSKHSDNKKRQLSNNSTSSSDDDVKRVKKDGYTSPSSEDDEDVTKKSYHSNLAIKFNLKYKEYKDLYTHLSKGQDADSKRNLTKLFELHQILLDWKKQLWAYDSEMKSKSTIMNLSKHKKSNVIHRETSSPPKSRPRSALNY